MGVNMVLLCSEVVGWMKEAKNAMKEWWEMMFKGIKHWSPQLVANNQMVWIQLRGIPLHVLFGEIIDFDEEILGRKV